MFKIDDGSVLEFPHKCHICESLPTKGEYAIDTENYFVDPFASHLKAHKYVCQKCAEELVALVPDKGKDKLKTELKNVKARYGALAAALDGLTKQVVNVDD